MPPADPLPAPDHPAVTLLGRDDCAEAAALRALLESLDVPYTFVRLDGAPDGDACGFVSPTVQIAHRRGAPEVLIQPSIDAVVDALLGRGLIGRRLSARALAA